MAKKTTQNEYDAYREALVVEQNTVWPPEYDDWESTAKMQFERQLHADPANATRLEYRRLHTGFCREIFVTPEDIDRLSS